MRSETDQRVIIKTTKKKTSLITIFSTDISVYPSLLSLSVFMALSTVFHSINSPDNSPFSYFVLPVLFLPYFVSAIYLFMKVSFSPDIIPRG